MATAPTLDSATATTATPPPAPPKARTLVCLPSFTADARAAVEATIAEAFDDSVLIVSPDVAPDADSEAHAGKFRTVRFDGARTGLRWTLAAGDYLTAAEAARQYEPELVVLLGDDSITAEALRRLAATAAQERADLTLPRYTLGPHEGLVNFALLYPLSRALYSADIRFPLTLHAAMSARGAERMGAAAGRLNAKSQPDALLWPVAEAAIASLAVREADAGSRLLPPPAEGDFNTLFAGVMNSLFADIEAKATFWQRSRALPAQRPSVAAPAIGIANDEVASLVEGFRRAYSNLYEVWSLVLPPQSLLTLKRLAATGPENFLLPPDVWARVVFDFILAFHTRTINRGHLIGSFTSLYLAWVASYIRSAGDDPQRSLHLVNETAAAFERERPYLLSRWRWPDRFNP